MVDYFLFAHHECSAAKLKHSFYPCDLEREVCLNVFFTFILFVLWIVSLLGLLVITFTNFKYPDLNIIVAVFFFFAILNSFFKVKIK